LIPEKETLTIEFKSDVKKLADSDIFESVVAMANTDGGDIYLGVENNGKVTGVHKAHENPLTLGAYIANNTVPPISIRTEILNAEKTVLRITVPKSYGSIAATSSGKILRRRIKFDGTPENIPMYPTELSTRLSALRLLDYSAMPVSDASVEDFNPLETERLRQTIQAYEGDKILLELKDAEIYKALGFVKEAEQRLVPTITGLLMVGRIDSIKKHIPTHSVSFQFLEGTSVKMNEDMVLPLLVAFEKLETFVEARNPGQEFEIGWFNVSVPDFNKRAIREAIVNAFSHRDYTRMGRVRVCVSDEGLTIANPGGFVEGVTINNLLTAEPHGRNPLLADALKRIGLAEKTGRGVDRIFEGSLIYGKQPPGYAASTSVTVSLLIPRSATDPHLAKIISNEQSRIGRPLAVNTLLILKVLRDMPRSSIIQIVSMTNLSEAIVKSVLENAIEAGLVKVYDSGRGKTYLLTQMIYDNIGNNALYVKEQYFDHLQYPKLVLDLASSQDYISRADVVNLLNVTSASAYRILKKLAQEGLLEPVNKGRYSRYRKK